MERPPKYSVNFVSTRVQEAVYRTERGEQTILLEFRQFPSESELVFTIVNGREFRVTSIHELVYTLPSLASLSLSHPIHLLWNGGKRRATLTEIFTASHTQRSPLADLQVKLVLDDKSYQTAACDTLQDAIWELHELTNTEDEWRLHTCYDCQYSGYARDYAVSDRQYWCYRDVPDAITEIQTGGKVIQSETRWAGAYFVDAFHTCAGWLPLAFASKR